MAQVAQQDPSTTAPKEPSISVDDTALTQPLVSEHIPPYQRLHGDSLAYPTHRIVDRSHTTKPPSRTMHPPHSPNHQQGPQSQSQRDPDHLPNSTLLQSNASISTDHSHSKSDSPPNKPVPLPEQDPSGRVDDPQSTSSLHREARPSAADFVATSSSPAVDQPNFAVINDSQTSPSSGPSPSETATANSADNNRPQPSPVESAHNPSGEQHPEQSHPEPSEATPPPVHMDQFQPNHPVYNMVATFGEMAINPMQYGPSVPMIPMQPHPLPLSPEQAAHVAHHQRQQQMFHHHQQPQTYYLWVPQERVGAVIGGHGTVIRSLQDRSGATIQVHNEKVQGDLKLFTIYGTRAQYETAAKLVNEIVERPRPSAPSASSVSSDRSHYANLGDHNARQTEMCKTVYVPSRCVGLVIGRNGETIRSLQDKSGAIIKVTRNEEATPGAENRSILISGTEEAISHAHQLVSEIVMEARVRRPHHLSPPMGPGPGGQPAVVEVLAIPNDKVGLIIGKKGATIKDLQMKSGAKIQVTKDDNCLQNDGSRPVTISGNRSDVDEAKSMIARKINVQMLSAISGTGAFPSGARAAIPPQPAGQAMPFLIPPQVYEQGFQNGQESFPPVFETGDPNNPGRAAMAYFQYMGYNNNYPGMGQHARGFQHPVPMQYGPPQQQIQEQQVLQAPQADQQDPNMQQAFHSPNVKPGQPMELPGSPPMLSRDANGGIFMYQGHPFQQMAQMPSQHQMFPPPPSSRMFSHREQAHVAHVQAQAQLLAHAQAHAHAQIAQTRAVGSAAQPQAMSPTPQIQAPVASDPPLHVHSHEDDIQKQQANVVEGEQSS